MSGKVHIVVPARMASTRLPRKPLADIGGQPMIVRVLERVAEVECENIIAAVDEQEVYEAVINAGHEAMMTDPDHPSGSDRVMEVAESRGWHDDDILVNVQGDEPLLPANLVKRLVAAMEDSVKLATVSEPIETLEDFRNPNNVKVVTGFNGDALYFSRAPIPHSRDADSQTEVLRLARRHVGMYAFRVSALRDFTQIDGALLETTEKLEQLRWLEAGGRIKVVHSTELVPGGVDTPEDLERVRAIYSH